MKTAFIIGLSFLFFYQTSWAQGPAIRKGLPTAKPASASEGAKVYGNGNATNINSSPAEADLNKRPVPPPAPIHNNQVKNPRAQAVTKKIVIEHVEENSPPQNPAEDEAQKRAYLRQFMSAEDIAKQEKALEEEKNPSPSRRGPPIPAQQLAK